MGEPQRRSFEETETLILSTIRSIQPAKASEVLEALGLSVGMPGHSLADGQRVLRAIGCLSKAGLIVRNERRGPWSMAP